MKSSLLVFALLLASIVDCRSRSRSRSRSKSYKSRQGNNCPDIEGFFSYDPESPCGPPNWPKRYPKCGGDKQSPIDIQTDKTRCGEDDEYGRIYYKPSGKSRGIFKNNGHAPNFAVNKGDQSNVLRLGEDEDGDRYIYEGLHFHIGQKHSSYGSEHTVDMHGYKGEIHMVHKIKKPKRNKDGNNKQKLLVIGIFFDVVDECGSYADKLISKYVTRIPNYLDKIKSVKVQPSLMLPEDGNFYYYIGSKTSPKCDPGVLWIVFNSQTTVCKKNYKVLMNLETWEVGHPPLSEFGNNRPIQRYSVDNVKTNFGKRCRGKD